MDKVLLGALDIESLFKWRDAHKEEVRSNPMPVRDLEIICKDSNVKVNLGSWETGCHFYWLTKLKRKCNIMRREPTSLKRRKLEFLNRKSRFYVIQYT